jgi:hypothetical protein
MEQWLFVAVSVCYVAALAAVDGLFNRLVFRGSRQLPHHASEKQTIYTAREWGYVGLILLVLLPAVLPTFVAYALGGMEYVALYWIVLLLVQWDMIFGKIVFGDWFGDTPSIALPGIGWMRFDLRVTIAMRVVLAAAVYWLFL